MGTPEHAALIRATVAVLGFDGYKPGMTEDVVESLLGHEAAIARLQLAMRLRKQGKFTEARRHALVVSQAIPNDARDPDVIWHSRAMLEISLNDLALGHHADAMLHASMATVPGTPPSGEVTVIQAVHLYETGETAGAMLMMTSARTQAHPRAAAAVTVWRGGTGL